MRNFEFYNPTRIIFGKGTIASLKDHVPSGAKVMVCYGGGSIMKNGIYDQVMDALKGWEIVTFGGIEANPDYDTLLDAIGLGRAEKVTFILAVGGGSVIDGAKLVAAGIPYAGSPWEIVTEEYKVQFGDPLPLATVLTIPATGSEMNHTSVISRRKTDQKLAWRSEAMFPVFSILDPTTTYSLPEKQVRNGIVDAYIHVLEQYITYPEEAPLQNRQAEAILLTLQEIGQKALQSPPDYEARASLMWCATNALNKLINKGVPEDWSTHLISHEVTAFFGLAHAEALATVLPHLYREKLALKEAKLAQYGRRVWGLNGTDAEVAEEAIGKIEEFFHSLGMPTALTVYGVGPDEAAQKIEARFEKRGTVLGEHKDIKPAVAAAILRQSR
jgi:NADP-dependent alcohol dehydrogenase